VRALAHCKWLISVLAVLATAGSVAVMGCEGIALFMREEDRIARPCCAGASGLAAVAVVAWIADRRPPRPGGRCACGYDLRGNVSGRCPECGALVRPVEGPESVDDEVGS